MYCCSFLTRLGERMPSMSSTLVETVSINYEDFNESFLTCGTCLCMYDGGEHTPKLLQCSHTVCLHCLTRIAASQTRDTGTFRCPICRELINIPRGGVAALPPSFLVNQLLDLMSRQRREVIPKCSVHINQELLFCETCDTVFCTRCTDGSHSDNNSSGCEHTIIPFSIAIKRMSEILLYKANECLAKLSQAQDGVARELERLDAAKERCLDQVNATFQQVEAMVALRKQEMINSVIAACQEKRKVLEEQHGLIETEKNKVQQECDGLQYQVEVRNITQRITSLSEKLDSASSLGEPRENAFLTCDFSHNDSLSSMEKSLSQLGKVRTSTTFPSLCTACVIDAPAVAGLEATVVLKTVDYHGEARTTGGDPITVEVYSDPGHNLETRVVDLEDGTYDVHFRPRASGRYVVKLSVFERPIKDCPLFFDVTEHNNPLRMYGTRGSGKDEFLQPVAIAIDDLEETVYIVDTGNSRIKVLDTDLIFIKHITNEGLLGRSCTGIAISTNGLVIINWRTKKVVEMNIDGDTIKSFTYNAFQEPIDVAVDKNYGHILVADNGLSCICVFDSDGKILFQVGKKNTFNLISSVTVGPCGEIVVADSRIQVFSGKGDFTQELFAIGKGKGRYGGIVMDSDGRVLASRSEKGRNFLQVLNLKEGAIASIVDSNESKLKRPSGIAITRDFHVIVVDLGNDCVKKYRYCNQAVCDNEMSTASRVRKSSPVKQGPMRATIPMASLLRHSTGLRKSPTLSPTSPWKTRTSPDSSPSGQRSPGSITYKARSNALSISGCEDGSLSTSGAVIRRTASLDTIYLKGQWPRDNFFLHSGLLQVSQKVDKATQTDDPTCALRTRLPSSPTAHDDKIEKLFRQRLQRRQASAECSSQTTTTTAPVNIPVKPLPKPPMRSSIEGLNQEIERLVLRPASSEVEVTPEGHRAPLADLLRSTRSVNTQTPAADVSTPTSRDSSPLIPGPMDATSEPGSQGSSPDTAPRLGTSPHINRFLAREPPDGCERVALRGTVGLPTPSATPALKPTQTFQLRPSQGSAFQPITHRDSQPIVPKQDII